METTFAEGQEVWFVDDDEVSVGKIGSIEDDGSAIVYNMFMGEKKFGLEEIFATKEEAEAMI